MNGTQFQTMFFIDLESAIKERGIGISNFI